MNEACLKLKEWSNILLPASRLVEKAGTLSSLDLTLDEAVLILQHLRDLFVNINYQE